MCVDRREVPEFRWELEEERKTERLKSSVGTCVCVCAGKRGRCVCVCVGKRERPAFRWELKDENRGLGALVAGPATNLTVHLCWSVAQTYPSPTVFCHVLSLCSKFTFHRVPHLYFLVFQVYVMWCFKCIVCRVPNLVSSKFGVSVELCVKSAKVGVSCQFKFVCLSTLRTTAPQARRDRCCLLLPLCSLPDVVVFFGWFPTVSWQLCASPEAAWVWTLGGGAETCFSNLCMCRIDASWVHSASTITCVCVFVCVQRGCVCVCVQPTRHAYLCMWVCMCVQEARHESTPHALSPAHMLTHVHVSRNAYTNDDTHTWITTYIHKWLMSALRMRIRKWWHHLHMQTCTLGAVHPLRYPLPISIYVYIMCTHTSIYVYTCIYIHV